MRTEKTFWKTLLMMGAAAALAALITACPVEEDNFEPLVSPPELNRREDLD